ncbi:MAG: DUF6612 family protein [Deltaproteobacteria bacterium]
MKKLSVAVLTILLVVLLANPAAASINYQVNGKVYQPVKAPEVMGGTTMVSLTVLQRTIGADTSISGNKITVKSNDDLLELEVGSKSAKLNGQAISLPQAPKNENGQIIIPIRGTLDRLGAAMTWQGSQQTVAINYSERQDGMTAEEILVKSNEALTKYNTYKMKGKLTQDTIMTSPDLPKENMKVNSKVDMDVAAQTKPIQVYAKYKINSLAAGQKVDVDAEMLCNESGMYMNMGDSKWIKMSLPGLDMKTIMEQAGGDDPLSYMKQMKEAGVILSLGNQCQNNGRDCWAVNLTMGKDALSSLMQKTLKNAPLPDTGSGDMGGFIQDTMKNMKGEIGVTYFVDKQTFLPIFMTMDMKMQMNVNIPASGSSGKASAMSMDMNQKGTFEINGWGESFTVPDVSNAQEMILPVN